MLYLAKFVLQIIVDYFFKIIINLCSYFHSDNLYSIKLVLKTFYLDFKVVYNKYRIFKEIKRIKCHPFEIW